MVRMFARAYLAALAAAFVSGASDADASCGDPDLTPKQIKAPNDLSAAGVAAWNKTWSDWRDACRASVSYNGSIYDVEELMWTQTTYMQPQMHPYDRYFWDPVERKYTVDKFLADLEARYGGIDSVLVWPTYTNIGIDDRNQFDMIRSMPGGVEGIRQMVDEFHSRGVKVLWPYHPWDVGTRRSAGSDPEEMAKLIVETGADGFNGDTMGAIDQSFYDAAVALGRPIALEAEGEGVIEGTNFITLGWGEGYQYPYAPAVCSFKWYESRRMTNICNRWAFNKTDDLQFAFFNGIGYETWENVWGTWNGIVERDGEAIRRVATVLRFFGTYGFFQSPEWMPYAATLRPADVFASRFPRNPDIVWTLVNRANVNLTGPQIQIELPSEAYGTVGATCRAGEPFTAATGAEWEVWDVFRGEPANATLASCEGDSVTVTVSMDIEALGYAAVYARPAPTAGSPPTPYDVELSQFLSRMNSMTDKPLYAYDDTWRYLNQELMSNGKAPMQAAPEGAVEVKGGPFRFKTTGVEIEGDDPHGVDTQYPWEMHPKKEHDQWMTVPNLYVDEYPVTCARFAAFLNETGYWPEDDVSFLEGWNGKQYPTGYGNKPVTSVSRLDAKAFCASRGMRLPETWEWQYAAQGTDGRDYPWGMDDDPARYPPLNDSTTNPPPFDVDAYPKGASPFGVKDLVGNVWQYTSSFQDDHTRSVILKGSSRYRPTGSQWYFPQAVKLSSHNKYFLFSDGYERSPNIGFRCVADAPTKGFSCDPGQVCGRLDPPRGYNDLTQEGAEDWAKFSGEFGGEVRKAGGSGAIGQLQTSQAVQSYDNNVVAFTWSDGAAPNATETGGVTTGIYVSGNGASMSFSVTATNKQRLLTVYAGVYDGQAKFSASLAGEEVFVDSNLVSDNDQMSVSAYRVIFSTKSDSLDGQELKVTYSLTSGTNINFQAIALAPYTEQ